MPFISAGIHLTFMDRAAFSISLLKDWFSPFAKTLDNVPLGSTTNVNLVDNKTGGTGFFSEISSWISFFFSSEKPSYLSILSKSVFDANNSRKPVSPPFEKAASLSTKSIFLYTSYIHTFFLKITYFETAFFYFSHILFILIYISNSI